MTEPRAATPLTLASKEPPTASGLVLGTLLEEHRTLRTVLSILERLLEDVADGGTEPDFALICATLYYIDDFPDRVHHPKEDNHLFAVLRRRTNRFNPVLDRLQSEHIRGPQMLARVQRELVHFQGGSAEALPMLRGAVSAYAAMLQDHMRAEEGLLQAARDYLLEEDWNAIAKAFAAENDPLAADSPRLEFRRLRVRIVNYLPRKMRTDVQKTQLDRPT